MNITSAEFKELTDLIQKKSGMFFEPTKQYFVDRRLESRMSVTNCDSVKDYLRLLRYDIKGTELDALVESLTD